MKATFDEWGFILVRGLLTPQEMDALRNSLETDDELLGNSYGRGDKQGMTTKLSLWNHPGDDVAGFISRSEKMAGTFEQLLGGEVYHYHSKLMQKNAFEGGAHVWHQDYGYWYNNGCLWPNMGTVFVAIDRATIENGCLRVLPKSHHAGRIRHHLVAEQIGADLERVAFLTSALGGEVPVEMESGDALFFHCNLLHSSAQNRSPHRRWAFLVAYNRADNDPVITHHHPNYTPLHKIGNSEILELAAKLPEKSGSSRDFLKLSNDISIKSLTEAEKNENE